MAVLFRGITLIASGKSTQGDFIFDQGNFTPFSPSKESPNNEINASGWIASPGWTDLRVKAGEPGLEYKETIESLCESLQVSGFSKAVLTLASITFILLSDNLISISFKTPTLSITSILN